MLLLVSRLVFCRSDNTSVSLHHTHMREQWRVIERNVDICIDISWTGRKQNNQQQCSQSHIFKMDVQRVYPVNSSPSSLAMSPLLDDHCGCCAVWATSCSQTTCRLQRTIYLVTDMIWNDKEPCFSLMCRVPCFLPLFFTYLCRLVSPFKVSHLFLFWNISIRKIDELNDKWSCKQFPGYRGYLALGNIFLSCVYPKDLYSRSHKVMSNSVCVLNLEIPSSCDGGKTDGWQKHFWRRLLPVWKGYLRKHINSHALYESLPMFFPL